jgi:hypothetical protein
VAKIIKRLRDFIDIHPDSKIVVCGCGISLLDFKEHHQKFITIGVNDVPQLFDPTYLLITDSPHRFNLKRQSFINSSGANHLFTCAKGWRHPNMVHFDLGEKGKTSISHPDRIDHFVNSPYVALGLAYRLGARKIGMIGVDFTDGHFYNPRDGSHPVIKMNYLKRVNSSYQLMLKTLKDGGAELYNLSQISKLDLPKITIDEFEKL